MFQVLGTTAISGIKGEMIVYRKSVHRSLQRVLYWICVGFATKTCCNNNVHKPSAAWNFYEKYGDLLALNKYKQYLNL